MDDADNNSPPQIPGPQKAAALQAAVFRQRAWPRTLLAAAAWIYFAALLVVWGLMRWTGDRWWIGTLLLFGPRWFALVPLALLALLALVFHRRSLWPLLAAAIVAIGPIGGFCIPWGRLSGDDLPTFRVLTCNLKGKSMNNGRLNALIAQSKPDIVALQGCWDDVNIHWPDGWHVERAGELVVASHFPLQDYLSTKHTRTGHIQPRSNLFLCTIELPGGEICFATVHLQSPHYGIDRALSRNTQLQSPRTKLISEETDARWEESEEVVSLLDPDRGAERAADIISGDLNLPVESPIYRTYWSTWSDAFSRTGWGFGYTEWPDETPARLPVGIRIDHVLTGRAFKAKCTWVGPDVGSDHLPLLADLYRVE